MFYLVRLITNSKNSKDTLKRRESQHLRRSCNPETCKETDRGEQERRGSSSFSPPLRNEIFNTNHLLSQVPASNTMHDLLPTAFTRSFINVIFVMAAHSVPDSQAEQKRCVTPVFEQTNEVRGKRNSGF